MGTLATQSTIMKASLFISALFLCVTSFGQTAPDFEVTDSDGIPIKLYDDLLNQGKTVVVKIFFTTCPPCRSIASDTELFYQEWGAGMNDVEFIELSNKSFDTDALVNGYKEQFGITFPSVGSEGGSLEAIQPYTSGDFGPFFGTPVFVVIAPDGSLEYDVEGPDLFAELDAAILATGAVKPGDDPVDTMQTPDPDPVLIDGKVHYYASASEGIGEAYVVVRSISGMEVARDTTDDTGSYSFRLDSAMVADSALYIEVQKLDNPKLGITATDLVLIQKHLLGLEALDATEKLFASDANENMSISAADLLYLIRLLLDIEEHFPTGESWIFFSSELDLGQPGNQPPSINPDPVTVADIVEGTVSPNFRGIKRGDVNDSSLD